MTVTSHLENVFSLSLINTIGVIIEFLLSENAKHQITFGLIASYDLNFDYRTYFFHLYFKHSYNLIISNLVLLLDQL